jgi:RNA polymerase sigma factor (sigma-70 family)
MLVLVHLDAAYNLARWITRDSAGADDAVQEACLRAFRFFDSLQGPSPKAWFMAVVRNASLDWLKDQRTRGADDCKILAIGHQTSTSGQKAKIMPHNRHFFKNDSKNYQNASF